MRKSRIAISLFGLLLVGAANAATVVNTDTTTVDVYGKAELRHQFNEGQKNGVDDSYFRTGVKVKQQLNPLFAAVGQYEGQANLSTHEGSRSVYGTRLLNGGISAGDFGTVSVGRHTGAIYTVAGMSDVAPEVLSGYTAANDVGFLGRTDNVVQYQDTLGAFTFTGQYKFSKTGTSLENHWFSVNEGDGYAASLTARDVAGTGFGGGVAYATTTDANGNKMPSYSVGANYSANGYYLAATHTAGRNYFGGKDFRDDEVIGQYTFSNGLTPSVGYLDTKLAGKRAQYAETGVTYAFNKNVSFAVDGGWGVGGTSDHVVKTGVSYSW